MESHCLKIALDSTPAVFHTGMYVALGKGWFNDEELAVRFISPDEDSYYQTPAQKLWKGKVDLAILKPEEFTYLNISEPAHRFIALASLLQNNTQAIGVRKEMGVVRLAHLDGKRYAYMGLPYEHRLLRCLIKHDRGKGKYETIETGVAGAWRAFLRRQVDVVRYHTIWEGVDAACRHIPLTSFMIDEHHLPYRYTHVLCVRDDVWQQKQEAIRAFLRVVAEGYYFATEHPDSAANLLMEGARHPSLNNVRFLYQTQLRALAHYGGKNWGRMDLAYWRDLWNVMLEHKVLLGLDKKVLDHLPFAVEEVVQPVLQKETVA